MNALPPGPAEPIGVPNLNPEALKAGKLALEKDTRDAAALVITDAETYAAVGSILVQRLREYDVAKALLSSVADPMYASWKRVRDLLSVKPHEDLIAALKKAIGAYDLKERAEKDEAARAARALVSAPASPNVVAAITEALTLANAPEASAEGVGTRFVWKVKRYNVDLMDLADLVPNETKINAIARAHRGDEPPFVRGVVFELEAQVSGKR